MRSRARSTSLFATSLALILMLGLIAAPATAASPTDCRVRNVNTGVTKKSLQKAVWAARSGHRLTVKGTCKGVTSISKNLRIQGIRTSKSGTPTLNGKGKGTVLTVKAGAWVKITGLTIRNGTSNMGAGVTVKPSSTLVLRNAIVRDNTSTGSGGGAFADNRAVLKMLGSSKVIKNVAGAGGGVHVYLGTLVMADSSAIGGNTSLGWGGGGVSIFTGGLLRMSGKSEIRYNESKGEIGGGVWSYIGDIEMSGSSAIYKNKSSSGGAGVYIAGADLTMEDQSTIRHNTTPSNGGGLWINGATLVMTGSSTIRSNTAGVNGGGIYNVHDSNLFGADCSGGANANVRDNTRNDCYTKP